MREELVAPGDIEPGEVAQEWQFHPITWVWRDQDGNHHLTIDWSDSYQGQVIDGEVSYDNGDYPEAEEATRWLDVLAGRMCDMECPFCGGDLVRYKDSDQDSPDDYDDDEWVHRDNAERMCP